MPANLKAVQSRIKSAKNTKKITKAMELVSAAKMRKALDAATRTRAYAQHMRDVLHRLAYLDTSLTGLLTIRPVKKVLVITISSNRGLCGSFNANVFKTTRKTLLDTEALKKVINAEGDIIEDATNEDVDISIIGIGKKTAWFAKKFQYPLIGVYDELTEQPSFEDVAGIARTVMSGFETGAYDKVLIAYTAFRSSLVQEPMMRQILPVPREILSSFSGKKGYSVSKNETEQFALEPDPATIV